jgi:hypothetical protein
MTIGEADNKGLNKAESSITPQWDKSVRWARTPPQTLIFPQQLENPKGTWYVKKDLATFREQCEITRILARRGFKGNNFTSCWGLEHTICEELSQNRSTRKKEALDTVIEEQEGQRKDGQYMPDVIAEIYEDISKLSQIEAHQQALRYVKELNEDDTNDSERLSKKVTGVQVQLNRKYPGGRKRKSYTTPMA